MVWWKVALPVVAAASGVAATVVAITGSSDASTPTTAVWIDSPADLAGVSVGAVTVRAHVDASRGTTSLTLAVDGAQVETDAQLDVAAGLAVAEFTWQATEGTHELVVSAPDGGRSGTHTVLVAAPGTAAPTSTVPPTTATSSTTTSSTSSTSTTIATTTTAAPPTTIAKPKIGAVTISDDGCHLTVEVASLDRTTSASVRITGSGNDITAALPVATPSNLPPVDLLANSTGNYPLTVVVTARGPGGTATSTTTYTVKSSCKP